MLKRDASDKMLDFAILLSAILNLVVAALCFFIDDKDAHNYILMVFILIVWHEVRGLKCDR